jgi:hypothetical protein
MWCNTRFIRYADFADDKRGKKLLKTMLYDSLKAWRPATDNKRTLEVGCPSTKCITRKPTHFPAASCFHATTTKQRAYWRPKACLVRGHACFGAHERCPSEPPSCTGARTRVGSRTQPAGLPGMRPASLARAGAQAPRPNGCGTTLSPTKRLGAAHPNNGSEQPALKPVHALVYSPAAPAARRGAGRADLCTRAAHRRGGHRKASRALCQLAGLHHTACARQWWRRMHHHYGAACSRFRRGAGCTW